VRRQFDVVAVGNAIVDILQATPERFLIEHGIAKAAMTLIDETRADHLTALFDDAVIAAGGSAANTVTGVASFGGAAGYIGKVADDGLGRDFTKAFRAAGVTFNTPPRPSPPGTARCLIAVTPDGQRSMSTYLGASTLLNSEDLDKDLIASGAITFLEGYLFDRPEAKTAFVRAAEIARGSGRKVALTLSDVFCVERHRESFQHLVKGHIDILFANERELLNLYETQDLDAAIATARAVCPLVAVTRSEKGSIIAIDAETFLIAAKPGVRVVDTTGAGDLYAAGFLFGAARNRPPRECAALGTLAAAEVISHIGPRPETSLKQLASETGLTV
jgi:sugar/nucleoside kinase (ribokinase family)